MYGLHLHVYQKLRVCSQSKYSIQVFSVIE
jgi:hypothetical protein